MKCPYCGEAMAPGRIEADNLLQWIPDGERARGSTRWARAPHGVVLAKYALLAPAAAEAYYCAPCGKVVIDTGEGGAS